MVVAPGPELALIHNGAEIPGRGHNLIGGKSATLTATNVLP